MNCLSADIPSNEQTAGSDARSADADDGNNDGQGTRSSNNEMDETHPVDDKDVVSHVFLPLIRRVYISLSFNCI